MHLSTAISWGMVAVLTPVLVTSQKLSSCKRSESTQQDYFQELTDGSGELCTTLSRTNVSVGVVRISLPHGQVSFIIDAPELADETCKQSLTDGGNCMNLFQELSTMCASSNMTISGSGDISTGCGSYAFEFEDERPNPSASPSASATNNASAPTTTAQTSLGNGGQIAMASGSLLFGLGCFVTIFL